MKSTLKVVIFAAVLALVSSAYAAETGDAAKSTKVKGDVVKVDGDKVTVKTADKDVVVATDAKTAVIIDKVEGKKVSDLTAGMKVTATVSDAGVATEIKAKSAAPAKPAGGVK